MRKTYILIGILIILFISLIFLTFDVLSLKSDLHNSGNLRTENILLKEGFFHSYDFEDVNIDFKQKIINSDLKEVTLKDVVNDKNTIALFIDVSSCDICTYNNIKKIKEFKHDSKVNILIGISGLDKRQFNSFVHSNKIIDDSYLIPEYYFSGFKNNPVVYFTIDSSCNLKYFYAPNDIFPSLTDDYLSKIHNILGE